MTTIKNNSSKKSKEKRIKKMLTKAITIHETLTKKISLQLI
jgi:hypothetical protein